MPGWPPHVRLRRERTHDGHRFDLELDLADGRTGVVEVKSLSRAHDHVAPLSDTPSTRGVAHLDALAGLAARGVPTAVVFVVQRADVDVFDLGAPADPAWVAAVRRVRHQGVEVVAFVGEVDAHRTRLGRLLEVRDSGVGGS